MVSFIYDLVSSYGSEMKGLLDREFTNKIIEKLLSFRIKKYEDDIFQQREVSNKFKYLGDKQIFILKNGCAVKI
jgi:hypothetical protein